MEGLSLRTSCIDRFLIPRRRRSSGSLSHQVNFRVFASKDDSKLDHWDQMELKFGRMLGEDPKLTLAKIMGRKSNPDLSYLEIEKSLRKKKSELDDDGGIVNVPLGEEQGQPSSNSLNLMRPVPTKKGIKFKVDDKPTLLEKKSNVSVGKVVDSPTKGSNAPNVILRKPSTFQEDPIETEKSSKLKIKPNLLLKMRREEAKENFSEITLLKKPEPVSLAIDPNQDNITSGDSIGSGSGSLLSAGLETSIEAKSTDDSSVAVKDDFNGLPETSSNSFSEVSKQEDIPKIGLQPLEQSEFGFSGKEADTTQSLYTNSVVSSGNFSTQAALQGKPQRLDQSIKERSHPVRAETVSVSNNSFNDHAEIEHFMAAPLQGREEADWTRVENLLKTGGREEVELISCSTRGFVASFGSLIGFLPYRNLGAKWKFLAFESWLRKKGLDPSKYKQNIGITGGYEVQSKSLSPDRNLNPTMDQKIEEKLSPDMTLEDLLEIYDQEKIKFLSSFVGQRIKVNLILADRNTRKLMFSGRPKEKEEEVEKKRNLMAKLSVGDVVKCCIKKITYFGIFVEVEGVPALIHQSEVSWDATLDPSSSFRIGQIVEAKVHQLDFALERITLSLKEIMPDPLIEALESVVGERNSLDGRLEAVQTDIEWADVESLIKELQQIEGVQSVSKGRFFLSPGLAPTFQVYMASVFEKQYKLLARSGNKVQEVIVQASLDKEEMKAAILTCTNKVE